MFYDLFIICVDDHQNALKSSIIFAMGAKRVGKRVAVFFVQGPLATLAEGKFEWAEELRGYAEKIEKI